MELTLFTIHIALLFMYSFYAEILRGRPRFLTTISFPCTDPSRFVCPNSLFDNSSFFTLSSLDAVASALSIAFFAITLAN